VEVDEEKTCRGQVVMFSAKWTANVTEPNGDSVPASEASKDAGQMWAMVDYLYAHGDDEEVVGINTQLCTRLDHANVWHCEGTYTDPLGCEGQVSYAGVFSDEVFEGKYTILGGTGDWEHVTGHILDQYSEHTGYSYLTATMN
jgi:hypothetical protein